MADPFFRQQLPGADRQVVVDGNVIVAQVLNGARRHRVAHVQIIAFKDAFVLFVKLAFVNASDEVVVCAGTLAFGSNKVNEAGQCGTAGFRPVRVGAAFGVFDQNVAH